MKKVMQRFKEPSTWAGLGALAVLFGVPVDQINAVTGVAGAVCAALAVFIPEKGKAE